MPGQYTYPGVYIEEILSGVRTISGVSTSVAAFVGAAKRGPVNKAKQIQSFADYERRFGGLDANSEMSFAVRQFFLNGGSEAWIVRVASNVSGATYNLKNADDTADVLTVSAIDEGKAGNYIEVEVDQDKSNPASTFNLTFTYQSPDESSDRVQETFENLSMNSKDSRYAVTLVNGTSTLVELKRVEGLTFTDEGRSKSDTLTDVPSVSDKKNQFRVVINGLSAVTIQLSAADIAGADAEARLANMCTAIQSKLQAASIEPAIKNAKCALDGSVGARAVLLTSGEAGEESSVRVLPGQGNDIAAALKLGTLNGGTETDAAATFRPRTIPDHGKLTSDTFTGADELANPALPDSSHTGFMIALDKGPSYLVNLGTTAASGTNLAARLKDIAGRIQAIVRALRPESTAYSRFTCTVSGGDKLLLTSGSAGTDSAVQVTAAASKDIAASLHMLTRTTSAEGRNVNLAGGNDEEIKEADIYSVFVPGKSSRKGIYALENVDLFNLLCLPGITESSTLIDAAAYCKSRRAFVVVDCEKNLKPDKMATTAKSASVPRSDHAAIYYPWIKIGDPLNQGKLRTVAPCGSIAGLYARTDSTRGVWKAPAGTDANIVGAQAVEYTLTDSENGTLNPLGVNCIRLLRTFGVVNWGARTLMGSNEASSEYKYIPVRRLALYIEESLCRGTKWVVFEPNDEPLWAQIRLNVSAFMHNLFLQGAFQGRSPREAYFVKCDRETTTQNDVNLGVVNIEIGLAPLKPAEFVVIKIQQIAGQIALQRTEPAAVWEDLVLPEAQCLMLREIVAHARQRMPVKESWGGRAKGARGLGISALFAGASGTGKTMAAEVLAGELRLDLYRIDLSQVVTKYIGDTEKNLQRVFEAAEESGAVLLFDEADALFGRRSEVKDNHDRYANIEVSYLLQMMESYRGLAILSTNMKHAIDPAFLRRIRFIVQFPFPDAAQRAEIWRRVFPSAAPVEGLDFEKLARLNVAGGNIRNIAIYATSLAAEAGEPVRMCHLARAARAEYAKLERPLTEAEIVGWE